MASEQKPWQGELSGRTESGGGGLSTDASTTPTMASKITVATQPQIHRAARSWRRGFLRCLRPPQPQTPHRWQSTTPHHPTTPHPLCPGFAGALQVVVYGWRCRDSGQRGEKNCMAPKRTANGRYASPTRSVNRAGRSAPSRSTMKRRSPPAGGTGGGCPNCGARPDEACDCAAPAGGSNRSRPSAATEQPRQQPQPSSREHRPAVDQSAGHCRTCHCSLCRNWHP